MRYDVAIISGGVIGSEIADALSGFGCKVTIVEMADRLIPTMDKDLGQRLGMFFKKKGIDVCLSAAVKKIEKEEDEKIVFYTDKNGNEVSFVQTKFYWRPVARQTSKTLLMIVLVCRFNEVSAQMIAVGRTSKTSTSLAMQEAAMYSLPTLRKVRAKTSSI